MGIPRHSATFVAISGLCILAASGAARAAQPPDSVNYQGVLRSSTGAPLTGSYDMVFRLFDDSAPGAPDNEILLDLHQAAGSGAVTVTGGLFNAPIGNGLVSDGSGAGFYSTVSSVFRDFTFVYLQIEVGGEVLAPRVAIRSVPAALNADRVDGVDSASFLRSDTSTTYTNGTLSIGALGTLDVLGSIKVKSNLRFNPIGPDADQSILFYDEGITGNESIEWEDSKDRFGLSDDIVAAGAVQGGLGPYLAGPFAYSMLSDGAPTPDSGAMNAPRDLYLGGNLEAEGTAYLNGEIRLDDDGPDADQNVFFYNGGSNAGAYLRFDDGPDRFETSHGLRVAGNLVFETAVTTVRSIENSYDMIFRKDTDNNDATAWFRFYTDASVEQMRIHDGDEAATLFDGVVTANGIDYAEAFRSREPDLAPGEVVSLVPGSPDLCARSNRPLDPNLLGVVSTRPGYVTGMSFEAEAQADPALAAARRAAREAGRSDEEKGLTIALREKVRSIYRPVALLGRVPVKVDAAWGPIRAGDRLTSSATPGHAMALRQAGPSIGIALESWDGPGPGVVTAYIQPGWVGEAAPAATGAATSPAGSPAMVPVPATMAAAPRGEPAVLAPGPAGFDLTFEATGRIEAGDLLAMDPAGTGRVRRSSGADDPLVVAVVANVLPGADGAMRAQVSVGPYVMLKVDASYGAIRPGDPLVASPTAGHAMKAPEGAAGTPPGLVVARALDAREFGTGLVRALLVLR